MRSSFGQSEVEGKSEESALEREILGRWILASAVLFLLIVSLAVARWIYVTPALDKISSASDIAKMVSGMSSANRSGSSDPVPSDQWKEGPNVKPMSNPGSKRHGSAGAHALGGKTKQLGAQKESTPALETKEPLGSQAGRVSLLPTVELPEKITLPQYPSLALRTNLQGRVMLKAAISKDGTLQDIRLVGAPSVLSAAVLEAVKKWRYRPRMENGVPVEVDTQITIVFEK